METKEVILYSHCDEWNSTSSMSLPDEVFANTPSGWKQLWEAIRNDLKDDAIEINGYKVEDVKALVLDGDIYEADTRITYAYLTVVPVLG